MRIYIMLMPNCCQWEFFLKKFLRVSTISTTNNNHLGKANSVIQRILEMQMEFWWNLFFYYSYQVNTDTQYTLSLSHSISKLKNHYFHKKFSLLSKGESLLQHRMPWFMSCENESMESVLKRIESDVLNHRALKSRKKWNFK